MAKIWAGRASGETSPIADDFNSSISFDSRMIKQDVTGSIAHASMLGHQGIITHEEAETLIDGLNGILSDIESGALEIDMTAEDVHSFVEAELTARVGDTGKKLHTARSRNDQVALDLRLYLRDEIDSVTEKLTALVSAVTAKAEEYKTVIMPGYT
ncbi:MAG: argininosuccinate lyase, partial [Firmicutes bacterium]|nr:argininosuccinate lyase [Candidatus Colimorpha enterica]